MRVTAATPADFWADIDAARDRGQPLVDGCIRLQAVDEPEQKERVTFAIGYWLSAIVMGDLPYVLECCMEFGSDQPPRLTEASQEREASMESIVAEAKDRGIAVRPGRVEFA